MAHEQAQHWMRVSRLKDVPPGEAKAIRLENGHSIALFNVEGRIYATDNQCPHMVYPLTRGAIRNGILTCDWHGRSFDLEGGGCFNNQCNNLQTFPVEVRQEEIFIRLDESPYSQRDEHLRLLWEGLLNEDRWTISKAIALLLKGGVPEEQIVEIALRHLGRHIASSDDTDGSARLSRLINAFEIGRRYDGADRVMVLATAARSVAGRAAERLQVVPLPGPVAWDSIDRWTRMFSLDSQDGRIERCLFTAWGLGYQNKVLPLLYECAVEPHFLGSGESLLGLGYLAEVDQSFGWDKSGELVFNLGARLAGRRRGEPERFRRDAVNLFASIVPEIERSNPYSNRVIYYEEAAFEVTLLRGIL